LPWLHVAGIAGVLLSKLIAFIALCLVVAVYVEPYVTRIARGAGDASHRMLIVANVVGLGTVLLVGAVIGKLIGAWLPAVIVAGPSAAVLIAVSMVPRAEIGHRGRGPAARTRGDARPRPPWCWSCLGRV
jgi:hypothetical protein